MTSRTNARIEELRRHRPRSLLLRWSAVAALAFIAWAWSARGGMGTVLSEEQRARNLERFLEKLKPYPVQQSGHWADALPWADELLRGDGFRACLSTLAIATGAILLSSLVALLIVPGASRHLASPAPFGLPVSGKPGPWRALGGITRGFFILTRAVPEYLYAFFLVAILGPTAWPLILALAIHNIGILGRLGSEVIDNAPPAAARESLARGGRRYSVYVTTLLPECFNRFLVYFFYRWETCVREATVLGMLGFISLGALIDNARVARRLDEMVFFVLCGAMIVMLGDFFSALVRHRLQRR
jgi:phosphonate transport system permease protein